MLDDDEIDAPFPEDLSGLRTTQNAGSVEHLIALTRLARVMDRIIKKIHRLTAIPGKGQAIDMESFVQLQDALDDWRSDLPELLKLGSTSPRGAVHLRLVHQHAIMLLTRTSLIHAAATIGSGKFSIQGRQSKFLHESAKACIGAAQTTIDLLKGLRDRVLLSRYACQDSLFCTTALCVLLLGAKLECPGKEMKLTIVDGVSILQQLCEGSETAVTSFHGIIRGFQPYFQASYDAPPHIPEPTTPNDRHQRHKAWQSWLDQATETILLPDAFFCPAPYKSTPATRLSPVADATAQVWVVSAGISLPLSPPQFGYYRADKQHSRISRHIRAVA